MKRLINFSLCIIAAVCNAQREKEGIALTKVRVINGYSNHAIEYATVLIKITSVNTKKVALGKSIQEINLSGKTIIPTLITTHSHRGLLKGTKTADSFNKPDNVIRQMQRYAMYGVETVTSLGRPRFYFRFACQK